MARKRKLTQKREDPVVIEDLPRQQEELTADQAEAVEGGITNVRGNAAQFATSTTLVPTQILGS